MRLNRAFMALMLGIFACPLMAQDAPRFELGFKGGVGWLESFGARGTVGAEACLLCSGNIGVFAEYTHWSTPIGRSLYTASDSFGVGLRLQPKAKLGISARPFLDIGIATARVPYTSGPLSRATRTGTGLVAAGGVLLPVSSHFYIRPQVRIYKLSRSVDGFGMEMGIGYRF